MSENIQRFKDARPNIPYTNEHAEEIEEYAIANDIPFCRECNDWHDAGDLHSS